jgi:hypothetical protein
MVLAVAATGQASAAPRHRGPTGTVSGVFREVGGPAPGISRPLPGVVVLTSTTDRHVSFNAGKRGMVSGRLPVGTYTATGQSPDMPMTCTGLSPVVVRAGHHTHFAVRCDVP